MPPLRVCAEDGKSHQEGADRHPGAHVGLGRFTFHRPEWKDLPVHGRQRDLQMLPSGTGPNLLHTRGLTMAGVPPKITTHGKKQEHRISTRIKINQ